MPLPPGYNVEQTIKQQVTITAGTTTNVDLAIPKDRKVSLKGYGYSWYATNTFVLDTGNMRFPSRTDQEGSASIPRIFESSYPVRSGGTLRLTITNGDTASHTYDVVFYLYVDQFIETASTGGELIIATGGSSGVAGSVVIYNSSLTTAANVTAKGVEVEPQAPATLRQGTKATTSAAAIVLASTVAVKKVNIRAVAANGSNIVYVGNATGQTYPLYALDSITIEIDDLAKIYIKRSGGTDVTVEYIAS